eukprot:UN11918
MWLKNTIEKSGFSRSFVQKKHGEKVVWISIKLFQRNWPGVGKSGRFNMFNLANFLFILVTNNCATVTAFFIFYLVILMFVFNYFMNISLFCLLW